MDRNSNLRAAKAAKNDEFYTQYNDIQKEINAYLEYDPDVFRGKTVLLPCDDPEWSNFTKFFAQNFELLGLKKLISTSFAQQSKNYKADWQPTLFETENPMYDADKSAVCGKIFIVDRDVNGDGRINWYDLEWQYLQGNGDFRSEEVTRLRDEADIIVTNPPFSLLREFIAWIVEGGKQFAIIGNMNTIACNEIFPLIKADKMWLGVTNFNTGMYFFVPEGFKYADTYKFEREINGKAVNRVPGCCWYTNIEHGRRHHPLSLLTMADNITYSRHKEIKGIGYHHYENFDALDVPFTDAIPSDYEGIMGVPITFLDKYCPEQFEIIGATEDSEALAALGVKPLGKETVERFRAQGNKSHVSPNMISLLLNIDGIVNRPYSRILIRKIIQK